MARCPITNPRKIRRLREITGMPVVYALTRGGSDHGMYLRMEWQKVIDLADYYYLDREGNLTRTFRGMEFDLGNFKDRIGRPWHRYPKDPAS